MKIAFVIQNLAQASDSVGFDCTYQYRIARDLHPEPGAVRIFANVFADDLYPNVTIEPVQNFWDAAGIFPDATIIYHFCDGWSVMDAFLRDKVPNAVIRWHNNTPPWFYAVDHVDFAADCNRGFDIISRLAQAPRVRFMVNSEFTRRQMRILGANEARVDTVFPASAFLSKPRDFVPPPTQRASDEEVIQLLFVGRVVPHKGHRHILSIAAVVQAFSGRKVRVVFAGAMEKRLRIYWTDLTAIAVDMGVELILAGLVSDAQLTMLYASSDAFICMSEHEGFGLPVFEAMRCHLPVVAWSTSAMADLLVGHPFASGDFDIYHFAACILAALEPRIRQKVVTAQNVALQFYSDETVRGQFSAALGRPLEEPAGPASFDSMANIPGIDDIADFIADLACWIRQEIGPVPNRFATDAPTNYVTSYDIAVHDLLARYIQADKKVGTLKPVSGIANVRRNTDGLLRLAEKALRESAAGSPEILYALTLENDAENAAITGRADGSVLPEAESAATEVDFKYIHQILISDNDLLQPFPKTVRLNIESIRRFHPEASYHLWGRCELHAFLSTHFEPEVVAAFDRLQAFALKADLARYCLLYVYGGLYSDLSNRFLSRWRIPIGKQLACFREHKPLHGALWMNQNSIIYASPGQPEIRLAIDLVLENVRNQNYGISSLAPTGPVLFGRVFAAFGRIEAYQISEAINVQVEGMLNRASYVNRDGTLIAARLQGRGGQPADVGLSGTNVYGIMWERREIYGEKLGQEDVQDMRSSSTVDAANRAGPTVVISHLHHIVYDDAEITAVESAAMAENLRIAAVLHGQARQMVWTNDSLREFIASRFSAEIIWTYDALANSVNRAEFGRYCLLYALGGLYVEPWLRMVNPIDVPSGKAIACFRTADLEDGASWAVDTTLLYAEAGQPEFQQLIGQIVQSAMKNDHGAAASSATGAECLGRILAISYDARRYFGGEIVPLTRGMPVVNDSYISQDGRLLAVRLGTDNPMARRQQARKAMWLQRFTYAGRSLQA
ncbi:glycosyltransferase [Sphingomonas sp. HH69]